MLNKKIFLLTDVLPYEIPLIYSNRSLFYKINSDSTWSSLHLTFNKNNKEHVSEPYNFHIAKNDNAKRLISLIHPLSQLQMLKFIEEYDKELIDFSNTNAIFSVRYPSGINSITQKRINKISRDLKNLLNENNEVLNNELDEYVDSYFEKKRYVRITDFYRSHYFKRIESKYSNLLKIDIQNCFYSIYTHSIEWTYLGDKLLAKANKNDMNRFSYKLDHIMMAANFGETNGLVVGPEFSRCVAEIVLSKIDNYVYNELSRQGIIFMRDYEIVRYMDDIFIFSNDIQLSKKILSVFQNVCSEYKLTINENKIYSENRPFLRNHLWVPKIKKILKSYFDSIRNLYKETKSNIFSHQSATFIDEVRCLLVEFEAQKHNIVSYILAYFERKFKYLIWVLNQYEEEYQKVYLLCKIIDALHYILVFSITSPNITKFAKLVLLMKNYSSMFEEDSVSELLFKKSYELIKYNQNQIIELLNLIIVLKLFERDLPEALLINLLEVGDDYFVPSTMLYYIDSDKRKYRYSKLKRHINNQILEITNNLHEDYMSFRGTAKKNIQDMICSKEFIIIHDMYSNLLVSPKVKKEIDNKIITLINNENWNGGTLLDYLVEYLRDFKFPFMNWNASDSDIINNLVLKNSELDSRASG
ncbi:antiviral reverse transcriptase Drt3b [Gorillibacterium timonense]|uniref:antiviral reverse transcriptase Drt3b n=1 Tax=Gorillibacterium timonense TaxID=1689269 RepID=UPI00071D2FD1|nr:antiviral reverse transcriptase Drt3b [Gorillibacterium timonense]